LQWLAEICIRRPVFAAMLVLALVVAGMASYLQLGVDRFPKLDMPTVWVSTTYRGAAAEEAESEVTQVLEDAVASVAGIDELRSISREGMSLPIRTFNLNRDIDVAAQDVRDAVNSVVNRLPEDVDPPVIRKQDLDASPILTLAVSGNRDHRELYVLADRCVKDVIESAPGVGQVTIAGAMPRAIQVNIEAKRLAAYGLSIIEVREAPVRQNADIPGGRADAGFRELGLRTPGRFPKPADFLEMVVATVRGTPVRLRDLGEVVDGTKEIGLAVLVTTFSLVSVFLPVSFLSSVTGRMLFQFGLTATVAILVSMLVSFSLTPMMCSRMLKPVPPSQSEPASRRGFYHGIEVVYLATLRWSMRHRWLVLAASPAVVAANVPLYKLVTQDYIPTNVDESEFEVGITAPEGATTKSMDAVMRAVEEEIRQVGGTQLLLTTVGTGGLARVNTGNVFVRLEDIDQRRFSLGRLLRETLAGRPRAAF